MNPMGYHILLDLTDSGFHRAGYRLTKVIIRTRKNVVTGYPEMEIPIFCIKATALKFVHTPGLIL